MSKVALRHQVVSNNKSTLGIEYARAHPRLNNTVDIAAMDTDSDAHEHVLRSLGNASIDPQEVGPLECLEPKAIHDDMSASHRKIEATWKAKRTNCNGSPAHI